MCQVEFFRRLNRNMMEKKSEKQPDGALTAGKLASHSKSVQVQSATTETALPSLLCGLPDISELPARREERGTEDGFRALDDMFRAFLIDWSRIRALLPTDDDLLEAAGSSLFDQEDGCDGTGAEVSVSVVGGATSKTVELLAFREKIPFTLRDTPFEAETIAHLFGMTPSQTQPQWQRQEQQRQEQQREHQRTLQFRLSLPLAFKVRFPTDFAAKVKRSAARSWVWGTPSNQTESCTVSLATLRHFVPALGQWAQDVFFCYDEPASVDLELAEDGQYVELRFQSGEVRLVVDFSPP